MRLMFSILFLSALVFSAVVNASTAAEAKAWLEASDARAPAAIAALIKAEPKNAAARVLLVRLLLRQGKVEEAIDIAKAAIDLAPGDAQVHYWLGNAYGNRLGQVGMLGKMTTAPKLRDAYVRAVELDPNLLEARSNLVQFYLQAPSAIGGGVDKARAQVAEIAKRDPARGHAARAQVLMYEKKPEEALTAYEAAYAAKPENPDIRMMVGLGYQQLERWEQAFAHFAAWTAADGNAAGAWYQLGRTSALSGQRLDVGAAALKRFLSLPTIPGQMQPHHALYRLGQIQAKAGDTAAARISFQQSLKGDPKNSDVKAALAAL